jgi:ketosteroid isomerase-like protein
MVFSGSASGNDDEAAVRAAVDGFYSALNAMFSGDLDPMIAAWSHADDVTYMGPAGGVRKGWSQVLADWKGQAGQQLGGEVLPKDLHVTVGQELAVVSNWEVGRNLPAAGGEQDDTIRATNIFRKEDGQWKMIGHHTDTLDFLLR